MIEWLKITDEKQIIRFIRASILMKLSEKQAIIPESVESVFDSASSPVEVSSLRLSLLVVVIEILTARDDYIEFYEWMRKKYFGQKGEKGVNCSFLSRTIDSRSFENDWDSYNKKYGIARAFREFILDYGSEECKMQFIRKISFNRIEKDGSGKKSELIEANDLKNPLQLIEYGIPMKKKGKKVTVVHKENFKKNKKTTDPIIQVEQDSENKTVKLVDVNDMKNVKVDSKDLEQFFEVIELKKACLDRLVKKRLRIIYDLRSKYFHTGRDVVRDRDDVSDIREFDKKWIEYLSYRTGIIEAFRNLINSSIEGYWVKLIE
ncbi:MAG: hypothetical protein ACFFD4_38925 [Candidatus Odinarchaeota archaeon]